MEPGEVAHACDLSIGEAEAGDQPALHDELQVSQGYTARLFLQTNRQTNKQANNSTPSLKLDRRRKAHLC